MLGAARRQRRGAGRGRRCWRCGSGSCSPPSRSTRPASTPTGCCALLRPLARRSALTATLITRLVPLAAADHARLREAAALRGPAAAAVGRAAIARRLVAGSLDRAVDVAATLELRGYARGAPRPRPPRAPARGTRGASPPPPARSRRSRSRAGSPGSAASIPTRRSSWAPTRRPLALAAAARRCSRRSPSPA